MSECNHNCSSCQSHCASYQEVLPTADTKIKNIIGVLSGKGGVGKSMVASLLAIELARKGYKVGLMDADITGPSIAMMFGFQGELNGDESGIYPYESKLGIKTISINMMLEQEDDPVLWRGPILGGVIRQFYTEVHWGELDYLIVDMPPGTADVAISVINDLPLKGLLMVTTPGKLVSMIVGKAVNMAKKANVEVLGLIENMAYISCPQCQENISIYKDDMTAEVAAKYDLELLAKLPLDQKLAQLADEGRIEEYDSQRLAAVVEKING